MSRPKTESEKRSPLSKQMKAGLRGVSAKPFVYHSKTTPQPSERSDVVIQNAELALAALHDLQRSIAKLIDVERGLAVALCETSEYFATFSSLQAKLERNQGRLWQ